MRPFFLFFLFCLPSISIAQNLSSVESLSKLAAKQYEAGDFKAAKVNIEKAISLFNGSTPDSVKGKIYVSHCKILFYNGQQKDALTAQRKAIRYLEQAFGRNHIYLADEIYNLAFLLNHVEAKIDSNFYYLNEVLAIYKNLDKPLDVGETLRYIGDAQNRYQNYTEAGKNFQEAIEVLEDMAEDYPEVISKDSARYFIALSNTYMRIAGLAQTLSDQDKLWLYMQKSQDLLEREGNKYPNLQREALENQARLYQYLGYFEQCEEVLRQLLNSDYAAVNYRFKWRIIARLAQVLSRDMEQYEAGLKYWKEAEQLELAVNGQLDRHKTQRSREMAYCHLKLDEFDAANRLLEGALSSAIQMNIPSEQLVIYFFYSLVEYQQGNFESALDYIQKSAQQAGTRASTNLARIYTQLSRVYLLGYKQTKQQTYLEESENWARKSLEILQQLENKQKVFSLSFNKNYQLPTEHLIACLSTRYQLKKDPALLEEIYSLMEGSKGLKIQKGNTWQTALNKRYYPEDLIQKKDSLDRLSKQLKSERLNLEEDSTKTEEYKKIVDQLLEIEYKIEQLQDQLFNIYPLNYVENKSSLSKLQSSIPNKQTAIINYFAGDSTLFVLGVSKQKAYLVSIDKSEAWREQANAILPAFSEQPQSLDTQLGEASYKLYQLILEPILQNLSPNIKQLLIAPDGPLANLPFTAFCTTPVSNTNFADWPYLIKKYRIAYLPFAGNIYSFEKRELSSTNLGCFAPIYKDNLATEIPASEAIYSLVRQGFYSLPGAQKEAKEIHRLFGDRSKLYADEKMDKAFFKAQAPDFQLLHLAMHAMPDYLHPTQSYLLFPGAANGVEKLSLLELSNIPLEAEHVALSACHTASGPYKAGEGIISMAYTLQELGVATTLSNDWAAPDQIAPELINRYYKNLLAGQDVDEALRVAQLQHLEKSGPSLAKHPYYWAGIKIHGNTSPLFGTRKRPYLLFAFIGFGCLVFLAYRFFFKRRALSV